MYRTDKQFMKNPATASQRIYVGGLPKVIVASDLEAKFKRHGKILGLVVNAGFAFVQFEYDCEAKNAIRAENGTILQGKKIVVKQAFASNQKPMRDDLQQKPPPVVNANEPPPTLDKTPTGPATTPQKEPEKPDQQPNPEPLERDSEPQDEEMDVGPNIRPPPPQKFDDEDRGGRRATRGGRGGKGRVHSKERYGKPMRDEPMYGDRPDFGGYGGRGDYSDSYGPPGPPVDVVPPPPERNDCEIIVVSRNLTEYAEFIESKLKQCGLIVDLLFPNEDVPIGKVLANISSRGCLYAILIMPQNEEHRSLTLNILHGIPQEHRNMPVEDALILLSRNFEAYMRGEVLQPEDPNRTSLADRHPPPIQMLFNLLAENRMLTTSQYDNLLRYLQERRGLQHDHEVAEGVAQDSNGSGGCSKEAELQSRILNILNKPKEAAPEPVTVKEAEPAPLLKDPTVQRALDSLLTGDVFRSIAGAGAD